MTSSSSSGSIDSFLSKGRSLLLLTIGFAFGLETSSVSLVSRIVFVSSPATISVDVAAEERRRRRRVNSDRDSSLVSFSSEETTGAMTISGS